MAWTEQEPKLPASPVQSDKQEMWGARVERDKSPMVYRWQDHQPRNTEKLRNYTADQRFQKTPGDKVSFQKPSAFLYIINYQVETG